MEYTTKTQFKVPEKRRNESRRLTRSPWDFTERNDDDGDGGSSSQDGGGGDGFLPDVAAEQQQLLRGRSAGGRPATAMASGPEAFGGTQKERQESIAEYLHKKREVFMLEYMIRVKKQEADNLKRLEAEEQAKIEREEAKIRREEELLEELIEKVGVEQRQVIAEAEDASRRRAECVAKIRSLNGEIFRLKSEVEREGDVSKAREGYRKFLVSLYPRDPPSGKMRGGAAAKYHSGADQADGHQFRSSPSSGSPGAGGRASPASSLPPPGTKTNAGQSISPGPTDGRPQEEQREHFNNKGRRESRLQRRERRRSLSKSPDSGTASTPDKDYLSVSPRSSSPAGRGGFSRQESWISSATSDRSRTPEPADIQCRKPEEVLGYVRTLKRQVLSLLGEMVALEDELVDVQERKDEILQTYSAETKQAEAEKTKLRQTLESEGRRRAMLEEAVEKFGTEWRKSTGFGITEDYFKTLRKIYAQFYPNTADLELTPIEQLTKIEDIMQEVTDEIEAMPTDVFVKAMKRQEAEKQKREKEERQQKLKRMREERLQKKINSAISGRDKPNLSRNN